MRRLTILVLAAVLAGCAGGDDPPGVERQELESLVVQPSDLPEAFDRFDEGRQARSDLPGGRRARGDRFGREDGWIARYKRSATTSTRGPLVIESRADLFEETDGADEELDTHRAEIDAGAAREASVAAVIEAPKLGQESFAATILQQSADTGDVRFYLLAWRYANVTATLFVNGFEGKLQLDDAVALGRKQQSRIERAAKSE